jgi:hypothetical protein
MKKKPGMPSDKPTTETSTSTRTRKGLFGRNITVTKTKIKTKSDKGESVQKTKDRTVEKGDTGNYKFRTKKTNEFKFNESSPKYGKNSKYKTVTKGTGVKPKETPMGTVSSVKSKERNKKKVDGKVTRSRYGMSDTVTIVSRPKTGEIKFR